VLLTQLLLHRTVDSIVYKSHLEPQHSPSEADSHSKKKKFPAFYGNRRFITVFTRVDHWFKYYARCIQSTPSHPISLRSILILRGPFEKVRGLTLLFRVRTLWRCGDGLFFEAPPLASDALLTTLNLLLENLNGIIRRVHELFKWPSYMNADNK
jgi:hypothetical protein